LEFKSDRESRNEEWLSKSADAADVDTNTATEIRDNANVEVARLSKRERK
jgi:hypothetical protein